MLNNSPGAKHKVHWGSDFPFRSPNNQANRGSSQCPPRQIQTLLHCWMGWQHSAAAALLVSTRPAWQHWVLQLLTASIHTTLWATARGGGKLGQEAKTHLSPPVLPLPLLRRAPEESQLPIYKTSGWGSTLVGGLGHTAPPGHQSQPSLAPSQLTATSPAAGKTAFAFCLSPDKVEPSGPSASICCGFSQTSQ